MRNIFLGILVLSFFGISCGKKDTVCNSVDSNVIAPAGEIANVQAYLSTNSITGTTQHPSGFFYKVTQTGTGQPIANLCSIISIKYIGKLTNGTIFDQTAAGGVSIFTLGQLIIGWQKGVPLISTGGKITLYIPPTLGYGSVASGPVPANSILIFDIELVAVTN